MDSGVAPSLSLRTWKRRPAPPVVNPPNGRYDEGRPDPLIWRYAHKGCLRPTMETAFDIPRYTPAPVCSHRVAPIRMSVGRREERSPQIATLPTPCPTLLKLCPDSERLHSAVRSVDRGSSIWESPSSVPGPNVHYSTRHCMLFGHRHHDVNLVRTSCNQLSFQQTGEYVGIRGITLHMTRCTTYTQYIVVYTLFND